jgi:magnesium chelatase family protein
VTIARTYAVALFGVEGHVVEVEADLANGLPGLVLVGLPDTALHESRDRVRAAVVNSGWTWPNRRITVGLSPAMLPKSGSGFDVAMAVAILAANGQIPPEALGDRVLIGELALDGRVRPVRGVLPQVLAAAKEGVRRIVVAGPNVAEARLVPGVDVQGVRSLRGLVALLGGENSDGLIEDVDPWVDGPGLGQVEEPDDGGACLDLAQVGGQPAARRALEISAAGGHHLFLVGPPGTGKTMLAERLPGLLPDLVGAEALEVTAIHSVAGVLPRDSPLVRQRPFRQPHHTASLPALVGGGSGLPRPGLASQAHGGVLFLDEAPEFAPRVLDALRQPLESGVVEVSRLAGSARFPARFTLVLAANPCPCSSADPLGCSCPPIRRSRYLGRLSGPLMDRVDLQVETLPVTRGDLRESVDSADGSAVVRERVAAARTRMATRYAGTPWRVNGDVPGSELRSRWPLPADVLRPADRALERGWLTARGHDRAVRVAWTIADLAGRDRPDAEDVETALTLRSALTPR